MAKDMISYSDIAKIAQMSVEEYRSSYGGRNDSDETIQGIIDRYKRAVTDTSGYKTTWSDLVSEAEKNYDEMYENSLDYLKMKAGVTDAQWDEAYNASVSDNYATGGQGMDLENITIPAGDDGVKIDWSELQTMKKTQLSDGSFKKYSPSDTFDDSSEIGETRNICGGTITYLGKKSVTYNRGEEHAWYDIFGHLHANAGTVSGNNIITGDNRVNMVHYEGVLGSFDYNADEFSLGYWESEVNGNKVRVPVLHYINDGEVTNGLNRTYGGFLSGEHIKIPDGLKSLDYTFADTGIQTMPVIPDSVESAHCAFMDCKSLYDGCESSKNDSGIYAGKLTSRSNLKDTSWMFAGCENMRNYFPSMSRDTVDGRYMYSECKSLGWDGETLNEKGEMLTSFAMPDLNNLRYADAFWLMNMFDGCDSAVIAKMAEYLNVEEGALKDGGGVSEWTDSEGTHNNRYDRLIDGSYDKNLEQYISDNTARGKILQLIDRDSNGLTGVASDTANLASMGVQITDKGTLSDDSVWAKFRQSDFDATFKTGNEFGDLLNHAIPAVGTYAISKSLLNKMTNGNHKAIATVGAVALAAVPQIVGVGNTLTPMLDWTANAVGKDNRVGRFLTTLSDKLKGNVTYHTAVSELNVDETFESMQESASGYAKNQVARLMTRTNHQGEDVLVASEYDISADMKKNGEYLAKDANLLFIACEPEENLKMTLTDSVMKTSLAALKEKMDLELRAAGSDSEKIESIRETYSGYYMTMLYNLDAYDNSAKQNLESIYATDPELKAQAENGLGKVMRCTAQPLYGQMHDLQEYWQATYGTAFFTDKQLNDPEKSTQSMTITGIGSFNKFDPEKDYSDQSDVYIQKLETYQAALAQAVSTASSQEEIDAAYASYYETAYGWALDEAEAHGVILDRRGAQTTSEKNSFATQLALLETAKTAELEAAGNDAGDDASGTAGQEEASTGTAGHQTGTAASREEDVLADTVTVYPDGVMFDETYYAASNPDVVKTVGPDKNALYTHFIAYGLSEGRPGYEGDAGQTLPADYTEEILAEYRESMARLAEEYASRQAEIAEKRTAQAAAEGLVTDASEIREMMTFV